MAGPTTVKSPMQADLDGGGYSIANIEQLRTNGHASVGSGVLYMDLNHNRPSFRWGTESPVTDPRAVDAQPGSLFSEFSTTPALWFKAGSLATDWHRVYPPEPVTP